MIMRTGGKAPAIKLQIGVEETRPGCKYSDKWAYRCPHAPKDNNLCMFHNREYVTKNQKQVTDEFESLVKKANESKSHDPLVCRGFYIPEINYERLEFNT